MVRLPERWQRVVEENVETVVQSRCWGEMKNVPVIATPGTNRRIPFGKDQSTRVPNVHLCCPLVAIVRNDTLVRVPRRIG